MKQIWMKYSYLFTISFFILGFFNIVFAWIGFFCIIVPFVFVIKDNKRTWCQTTALGRIYLPDCSQEFGRTT